MTANIFFSTIPNIYYTTVGGQTCTAGGLVQFPNNAINPRGYYTAANHTFTAPYTCYVEVFVNMVQIANGTVAINLFLYKSGANSNIDILWVGPGGTNNINPSSSGWTVISCIAGDALSIRSKYACSISSGHVMYKVL